MKRHTRLGIVFAILMLGSQLSHAVPIVFDLSSSDDLSMVSVGDTVTFDVSISGLIPDSLEFLAAEVFTAPRFGLPSFPQEGPIVPDPTEFMGFVVDPSVVSGRYGCLNCRPVNFIDPITDEGIFFSFEVTAQTPGIAIFQLFGMASELRDPFVPLPTIVNQPDPFLIFPAGAVVPEPATLALFGLGLAGLGISRRKRALLG